MTGAASGRWTSENRRHGFDRLCRAMLWRGERPAVIRPIYASTAREESASTKREAEAAARLEWLDSIGALPEFPRTEDTQPDESVAERDRVWADLTLRSSGLELIQIIRAKLDELDERDTKTKLSYFSHMFKKCPWLGREWPGATTSASELLPSSQDATGSPADGKPCAVVESKLRPLDRAVLEEIVKSDVRMTRKKICDASAKWDGDLRGTKIHAIGESVKRLLGAELVEEPEGNKGLQETAKGAEQAKTNRR